MATGCNSEDSGYLSVQAASGSSECEVQYNESRRNSDPSEYSAMKSINKTLNAKNKTLKQEIKNKTKDFNAQTTKMERNYKRETDALRKRHEKTLERVNSKAREIEKKGGEEITRLKGQIELLEKSEKELREKVEKGKHDEKHKNDYEKLSREMSASKEEIKILKKQITVLETRLAEKEQQISAETERNLNLSAKLDTLAKQHVAIKKDLVSKMDEKEKNTREMIQGMEKNTGEMLQGMEKNTREVVQGISQSLAQIIKMQNGQEINTFDQRENTLPPIVGSTRLSQNRRKTFRYWRV